jgi:hypothetical protein
VWKPSRHLLSGGFPYSEGIYEDINKVITSQLYWKPSREIKDIIKEYAGYEFSWEYADRLTDMIIRLGDGAEWDLDNGLGLNVFVSAPSAIKDITEPVRDRKCYSLPSSDQSVQNTEDLKSVKGKLTPFTASSWRWRLLELRVLLEASLRKSGGRPTDETDRYFDELIRIYYARNADGCVYPPTGKFMAGLIRNAARRKKASQT